MFRREFVLLLALMWTMLALGTSALYVTGFDQDLALWFATILIVCPISIIASAVALAALHESAHAIVGRVVGFDVIAVVLGRGRSVTRFSIGSTVIDVRGSLIGGVTICVPKSGRLRHGAFYVAGVATEVALVAALLMWEPDSLLGFIVRTSVIGIALVDIFLNLWPSTFETGAFGVVHSDGAHLIQLLRGHPVSLPETDRATVLEQVELFGAVDAGDHERSVELARSMAARDPDPIAGQARLGWALLNASRWREGYDLLEPLSQEPDADPMIANTAAWAAVMSFDDDLLDSADRLSSMAMAMAARPTAAPVCSTRGAALVVLGRPGEALPLLKSALRGATTFAERAIVLGFITIAHHDLGDHRAVRKRRAEMISFDKRCPLRDEVERRLLCRPRSDTMPSV